MPAKIKIIGQTFGRLKVVADAPCKISPLGKLLSCVTCECSCGTIGFIVRTSALRSGNTESCGCLRMESMKIRCITHGHSHKGKTTPTYASWSQMIQRCTNPKTDAFPRYGGRGIKVCDRWSSFENFLADMGEKPIGLTIGRKDNDGNYEPRNCRWETHTQQMQNTSRTVSVTIRGVTGCFAQVCRHFGINPSSVQHHTQKGVPLESAFEISINRVLRNRVSLFTL